MFARRDLLSFLALVVFSQLASALPSFHEKTHVITRSLHQPSAIFSKMRAKTLLHNAPSRIRGGDGESAKVFAIEPVRPSLRVVLSLFEGLRAFAFGVFLCLRFVFSGEFLTDPKLTHKILFTPSLLLAVYGIAYLLRFSAFPFFWLLKQIGCNMEPGKDLYLQFAAIVFLVIIRELPQVASDCSLFFGALRVKNSALAEELESKPVLHGLKQKIWKWAAFGIAAVIATIASILLFPVVAPFVAAAVASGAALVAAAGPVVLIGAGLALVLAGVFGAGFSTLCLPFLKLYSFDPVLVVLALCLVVGGLTSVGNIGKLLTVATKLYFAALVLTEQLLAEYWQRLPAEEWQALERVLSWQFLGFGLPLYAMANYMHPVVLLASIQVLQGAAAGMVHMMEEGRL